ncbi:hypothetical protein [Paenibacillus sp. MMS18-CY102]|uniref:hypothetical protein n=1 Tax=Paenibacillus sp. MMS18-CY102 TaxID=2682849 RepID=UPI0013665601|nr:hypothetical protein [Paenibacillus sp. MMS18-CY102]MWC27924.1 hypothetical protein [Paenibacillus sp. MMS18-CY102]
MERVEGQDRGVIKAKLIISWYYLCDNGERRADRHYDLHHYAASAARFLGYDATYELLSVNIDDSDQDMVFKILQSWKLPTVQAL